MEIVISSRTFREEDPWFRRMSFHVRLQCSEPIICQAGKVDHIAEGLAKATKALRGRCAAKSAVVGKQETP